MMLKVGLTGGIASGKSTVREMFREMGAHVVDSDAITHALLEPGQAVHAAVVNEFGPAVVDAEGRIDRRALAEIVFPDPSRRETLNRLVHPGVAAAQQEFLAGVASEHPNGVAIVDAALMVETGSYRRYDRVVVVSCPLSEQRRRLRERGLGDSEIDERVAAQMPLAEKLRVADYVIDNSGDLEATRKQVEAVWSELRRLAEG
jgi:dephospho-CoA kinase